MIDTYTTADARDLLKVVSLNSVQLTITSPPYADMKNYGGTANQIGFGQDYKLYLKDLKDVFRQVYKASTETGTLWVVINTFRRDNELQLLPFDFAQRIRTTGWILKDVIIWHKTKTLPWSRKGQVRDLFEYVLFFSKGNEFKYNMDRVTDASSLKEWWVKYPERYGAIGKVPDNLWEFTIPTQGSWAGTDLKHACPFPLPLVERIVDLCSDAGDLVLDPFAGSGTVLAQACCMGRHYVGCDLNESYKEMFHSIVLPDAETQWQQRQDDRAREQNARERLTKTIPLLRQVKFPKQLMRELRQMRRAPKPIPSVLSIIAIGQTSDFAPTKGKFLSEKLFLIVDPASCSPRDTRILDRAIRWLCNRPPLSKYGIDAQVNVLTKEEAVHALAKLCPKQDALYLYPKGRFWWSDEHNTPTHWFKGMSDENWQAQHRNGVPPILSNIHVQARQDSSLGC